MRLAMIIKASLAIIPSAGQQPLLCRARNSRQDASFFRRAKRDFFDVRSNRKFDLSGATYNATLRT
jgi:hypothetical protein